MSRSDRVTTAAVLTAAHTSVVKNAGGGAM